MVDKKKIRGISRKYKAMKRRIDNLTENFSIDNDRYWHMHLPVSQAFIDSPKTPHAIKRDCIQLLIDRVEHLISIRPPSNRNNKVLAAIDLPDLFGSQIIIFYDEEYYKSFFHRQDDYQRWTKMSSDRNLVTEWNLNVPPKLGIKGYVEEINDEDYTYKREIWFIGEV